jgi:hypothetical protein
MTHAARHPVSSAALYEEFDFTHELPPGEFFTVNLLASLWKVTDQHVINLIECGELETAVDLSSLPRLFVFRVPESGVIPLAGWLAKMFRVDLPNGGKFRWTVIVWNSERSRSLWRIPRRSIVEFLNRRKSGVSS